MNPLNQRILICGVGGHGIVRLGHALVREAVRAFPHVSLAENKGLSQRGGAVSLLITMGNSPVTPSVQDAPVDILLSTDLLETCRHIPRVNFNGWVVTHSEFVTPGYLSSTYTDDDLNEQINGQINALPKKIILNMAPCDAPNGHRRVSLNAGLLGASCLVMEINPNHWLDLFQLGLTRDEQDINQILFEKCKDEAHRQIQQIEDDGLGLNAT